MLLGIPGHHRQTMVECDGQPRQAASRRSQRSCPTGDRRGTFASHSSYPGARSPCCHADRAGPARRIEATRVSQGHRTHACSLGFGREVAHREPYPVPLDGRAVGRTCSEVDAGPIARGHRSRRLRLIGARTAVRCGPREARRSSSAASRYSATNLWQDRPSAPAPSLAAAAVQIPPAAETQRRPDTTAATQLAVVKPASESRRRTRRTRPGSRRGGGCQGRCRQGCGCKGRSCKSGRCKGLADAVQKPPRTPLRGPKRHEGTRRNSAGVRMPNVRCSLPKSNAGETRRPGSKPRKTGSPQSKRPEPRSSRNSPRPSSAASRTTVGKAAS